MGLLAKRHKEAIAFIYIKNNTLFVAVKHPGLKMEIDYNKDLLKSILTTFSKTTPECQLPSVDKVAVFHSKFHLEKILDDASTPYYTELAQGDFAIRLQNPTLQKIFEQIKHTIKCNH